MKRAFTLTELLVALAIMSLIALSIAGATGALSSAYAHSENYSDAVQSARIAMLNMGRDVRSAWLVTAMTGSSVVLWTEDANHDDMVNQEELAVIWLDGTDLKKGRIDLSAAGASRTALNISHDIADVSTVAGASSIIAAAAGYKQYDLLASNVRSFRVWGDQAPPATRLLVLEAQTGDAIHTITLRTAITLRHAMADPPAFALAGSGAVSGTQASSPGHGNGNGWGHYK
jgi:prepilin-type N-terminal cleavage/methylation domain-containing protein